MQGTFGQAISENTKRSIVDCEALGVIANTGADMSARIQAIIDDSANAGRVLRFPPGIIYAANLVFGHGQSYVGSTSSETPFKDSSGNTLYPTTFKSPNGANPNAVWVSDRWNSSDSSLGRPTSFSNLNIDGNSGNNTTGHGMILCNFRPVLSNVLFTKTPQNAIHMPATYRNGTEFAIASVGARILNCRVYNITGDALHVCGGNDKEQGTYTDGWLDNFSVGVNCHYGVYIEPGSGWFVTNSHIDNAQHCPFYMYKASGTNITNLYLESWGYSPDEGATDLPGIEVAKVQQSGLVVKNLVGYDSIGSASGVTKTLVKVRGGASANQPFVVDGAAFQMASVTSGINVATNINCSSGGSIFGRINNMVVMNLTRVRVQGATGTITIRENSNTWNYGTAAPVVATGAWWYTGQEVYNTDPTSLIQKWVCTASGNPGTWAARSWAS